MSKQPNTPKKDGERTYSFKLPRGFDFPKYPGVDTLEDLMKLKPLPGREEEYHLAMRTIESVCNTDFSLPIDLENVCGHKAPGVVMKEGYCMNCFEEQNIAELMQLFSLAKKVGPDEAARMMQPGTSSSGASSSGSRSTQEKNPKKTEKSGKAGKPGKSGTDKKEAQPSAKKN